MLPTNAAAVLKKSKSSLNLSQSDKTPFIHKGSLGVYFLQLVLCNFLSHSANGITNYILTSKAGLNLIGGWEKHISSVRGRRSLNGVSTTQAGVFQDHQIND